MKKFLIISGSLLLGAIIATVFVFWYVTAELPASSSTAVEVETSQTQVDENEIEDPVVVSEGIPLRNLPLGDGQKSVLDTVGVEVETFVITPAMQTCALEKLGEARMSEIIAGEAPSLLETTRLLPCLSVE